MLDDNGFRHLLAERQSCPLCGSVERSTHIAFPDIPIVKCRECAFMFSARILTAEALDRYYRSGFGSDRHLRGQQVNAGLNIVALDRLVDLSTVSTFLDVGTGYGFLPSRLQRRYGIAARGFEISEQEARYATEKLGLDVRSGPLADAGFEREGFDVVACFEVIEHVERPGEFLDALLSYVRPGGRLVVGTDNFDSWVCRRLGPQFPKWIPHSHISHFAPATLTRCLESVTGLRVVAAVSFNPWELLAKALLSVGRAGRPPSECFDLTETLRTEMAREYRLYRLRRVLGPLWFRATLRTNLNGALMYAVAEKSSQKEESGAETASATH